MKNKLFTIVACCLLMAFCGSVDAQPSTTGGGERITESLEIMKPGNSALNGDATIDTRGHRINSFDPEAGMLGQRLDTCGNNAVDIGEECEFITMEDGTVVEVVADTRIPVANFAPLTCPENTSCNASTCRCEVVPICGDGILSAQVEQCEAQLTDIELTPELMDRMCTRTESPLTHWAPTSWFTPPALAQGAHYVCNDCICATCGNNVKDPGEECDGTPGCNSECKLAPPVAGKIKCSIKQYGALDAEYIDELNKQGNQIINSVLSPEDQVHIDLFGQELSSMMVVQIEFPDTVIPTSQPSANIESSLLKSGDVNMTSTGIVQLGGPVLNRLSTMVHRPKESIKAPLALFPRGSGSPVPSGASQTKSTKGEDVTILVPDMSSTFPETVIESDLSAAGLSETDVTVISANEAALNGVARFMVVPGVPTKAQGEATSKQVIFETFAWPAPPGFTGGGDVIEHDPVKKLAELQEYVNKLKAEGRTDEIGCDIAMKLTNVPYEDQMVSKFAAVTDTVKIDPQTNQVSMDQQQVQGFAFYSVITEGGYGGRAKSPCSLTGAAASVPEILVTLGMIGASLAGVGIIRRRRRK